MHMIVDPIIKNIKWNPFIKIKAHLPMSPPRRGGAHEEIREAELQ